LTPIEDGTFSFSNLADEGAKLPFKGSKDYYGLKRNQNMVEVEFYEAQENGVTSMNEENSKLFTQLGYFTVSNLVHEEGEQACLEITVNVNRSGFMRLTCKDKKNEKDPGTNADVGEDPEETQTSALVPGSFSFFLSLQVNLMNPERLTLTVISRQACSPSS
jgi:hypothetical protein